MSSRELLRQAIAVTLVAGLAAAVPVAPATASPADAAFSSASGTLDVDYAGYLSKHDIVYNRVNTNPLHGLTVGNGRTGAMVWGQSGLTMQVSGVDLSQQSAFAAGLVNLATTPAMDSAYMIAAGGFGNYPFHFINGVFRATADQTKWSNGYWYWNQRDVYNSFLASNHVDLQAGFNRLYSRNYAALKAYTQTRYAIDGLLVPETMGWDGNAPGHHQQRLRQRPLLHRHRGRLQHVNNSDGSVSLLARINSRYVVAENGGAAALIANRTAIGPWEKFDLVNP